ncbi:MAG TPA: protein translocase subunit SecF, partial [Polyangiaceae bacterium]
MRLFKSGRIYDFMSVRHYWIGFSFFLIGLALVLLFMGKAHLGTDFLGGTEIEVAFTKPVDVGEVRSAVHRSDFSAPSVVKVDDPKHPFRYLIRVHEVSTISQPKRQQIERILCLTGPPGDCPEERRSSEVRFSPGGDKITVRFRSTPDLAWVKTRISAVKGISLRPGENNPFIQNARDNKVEIQLMSKGDQLMAGLHKWLGADRVPQHSLRTEWIGPRAGAQLRDSAIKSVAISIVFIMVYIAFRFDVRFAPGCV